MFDAVAVVRATPVLMLMIEWQRALQSHCDESLQVSMRSSFCWQSSYCIVENLIIDCPRFRLQEPSGRERWCFIEGLGWRVHMIGRVITKPTRNMTQSLASIVTRCRNGFPLSMVDVEASFFWNARHAHDENVGRKSNA